MFFASCVTVGLVFLASKYRNNVLRSVQNIYHSIITNNNVTVDTDDNNNYQLNENKDLITLDKIILADSLEKCDYAVQRIRSNLSDGVLGFDCEWVNEGPVSLLQLATHNGICVLFRLGKIGYIPQTLQELLANEFILKVGVAPYEDGKKLTNDYGCAVVGTLDLRILAERLGMPVRNSLAALCLQYLGVEMDKILEVRCGNWDADSLTNEQIEYAAYDAVASVLIYRQIHTNSKKFDTLWGRIAKYIKIKWGRTNCAVIHNLPEGIIDTRYRSPSNKQVVMNNNNVTIKRQQSSLKSSNNLQKSSAPTRKEPLYHNCYLQAPDGEILCTCDRKKAEWYITKELGIKINDEPLTVRLNFEPSGRASGEVGQYYTQVKVNQCVVCGAQDKFIKKNVVPREYRKYFPLIMKAHQSHDVLLLCPACHEVSNRNDLEFRKKLAVMCDAPLSRLALSTIEDYNNYQCRYRRRKFESAMKALRVSGSSLPPHRKQELESNILEYTQSCELYNSHYDNYEESAMSLEQTNYPPHGLKVVQYFTDFEGGLVTLEQMWREHFLTTMQPQYLPKLWSIRHNQERLEIRKVQNRIQPQDAKIAGLAR
ncbi:hypothetical protein PV327_009965 [Microctonus hyperodae]|uniref:3'-5' exonuclease domain-containing protein n=1 Tax=Microctonus hyperodae TaxID=165561 RepID=A0AA39KGH5_MICHY|nr:hypothetical protein PV327_009965 [Microctonus hyperodae]